MAVAETAHHEQHGHGKFIAHHFDDAEQQFQSGKLGIWLFLVTEVLFFSGLFVAYTLWRVNHPEIFQQAHVFLDKFLGGINTVVLLFSSLTMAMAVRSAQLENHKGTAFYTLITMVCAAVFLGVKAIEYSHKWDQGILVRSAFAFKTEHKLPDMWLAQQLGVSDWLIILSILPAILLVGFFFVAGVMAAMDKPILSKFFVALGITVGGYFLGAVGGQVYMNWKEPGPKSHASATAQPLLLHADSLQDEKHAATDPGHVTDEHAAEHSGPVTGTRPKNDPHSPDPDSFDRDIGIFFSIYYCMTGLHAFHILCGIVFLAWIYLRSLLCHWRSDYFGPVDYVGLYWHLVDLIWIYLFPLLYLID
jgi:cytochrome c oxidase subunit 3